MTLPSLMDFRIPKFFAGHPRDTKIKSTMSNDFRHFECITKIPTSLNFLK